MVPVKLNMLISESLVCGFKEGLLIKKGEIIRKVKQEDMVEELKKEILLMIK